MLRDKMLAVMGDVNNRVAEREELIEAIAVALLTRKNLFILGDTGQAKSFVINEFRKRITGARQFERLMSKQADEEQLFGRIDLSSLIPGNPDAEALAQDTEYQDILAMLDNAEPEDTDKLLRELENCRRRIYAIHGNKPKLVTTGKIPDSHIVFLDEIFKANDGILNSLLTALNERRFTNEGTAVEIPAISFFAASNEIPNFNNADEKILKPLYDRLELKLVTEYVQDKAARLTTMKNIQSGRTGQNQSTITLDELCAMQDEVSAVTVPGAANELMDDILCELRDKGVHVSDRKYFGYYPLAQAIAWLRGGTSVEASDLLILRHYLWTNPEELAVITPLLERKCINPLKDKLDDILRMGVESFDEFENTDSSVPNMKRIGKLRNELVILYETIAELIAKAQSEAEANQIGDTLSRLEDYSQKAHTASGYTYMPMNELYDMNKTA